MHSPWMGTVSKFRAARKTISVFLKNPPNRFWNFNGNIFRMNLLAAYHCPSDNISRKQSYCIPTVHCACEKAFVLVQKVRNYFALNFR